MIWLVLFLFMFFVTVVRPLSEVSIIIQKNIYLSLLSVFSCHSYGTVFFTGLFFTFETLLFCIFWGGGRTLR